MKWAWDQEDTDFESVIKDDDSFDIDLDNIIEEEQEEKSEKIDSKYKAKSIENQPIITSKEIDKVEEWRERKNKEIDEHPIYNKRAKEVYIEDGVTVEDYLKNKRSKHVLRGVEEKVKEIKRERYKKELDEIGYKEALKEAQREDARKRDKKKKEVKTKKGTAYIYNEEEYSKSYKSLLRNLGMKDEEFRKALGILTPKEKGKLLSTRTFKQTKIGKGAPKVHINIGDRQILEFLYKFRIASRQILERAIDKNPSTLYKTLERMTNMGLVTKTLLIGNKHVWQLTKLGAVIGELGNTVNRVKMGSYPKMFVENYVASCLYSNKVNILQLEDFPYYGRNNEGEIVRGETIYSEKDLKSSLAKKVVSKNKGKFGSYMSMENVTEVRDDVEGEFRKWKREGGESPDSKEGNEYMYILYPTGAITNNVCIPDIVVQRPRKANGESQNIAVEVEIKSFKTSEMKSKITAYKQDNKIYSKVIFVVKSSQIAEKIEDMCSEVGFDRYDIVPFIDDKGEILKFKEAWDL